MSNTGALFPVSSDRANALRVRLAELERENLHLRHQRDILKKTLGLVSTT